MQVFFFVVGVEQYLDNLKRMDLRYSKDLIKSPDFTGVPRLESLHLSWCNNLVGIHPSIGQLSRLIVLDLEYCVSLTDLPGMSSEMESLKILKLCGCSKIRKIPEFKGIMRSLSELHLDKTTIKKLPSSIEGLTALTLLSLRGCQSLTCLPRNMDSLRSLEKLIVIGCSKLTLPRHLWNMNCLEHDLSRAAFRQPSGRNFSVRWRSLSPTPRCNSFDRSSGSYPTINLSDTTNPESIIGILCAIHGDNCRWLITQSLSRLLNQVSLFL